ncbi:hypothetical protein E2C01_042021 [Portunus trituberculatus]|uniref:Uncharacterized protein n=1 Tax=Portunus trituberculatus TaxID=210409 RepID=A0A5B7FT85_PORTR|nr:hypothetical protein [Portunus trituberculatus]
MPPQAPGRVQDAWGGEVKCIHPDQREIQMETKLCNRESKSCSAKYGIFYRFVYTRVSCSVNSCPARLYCERRAQVRMENGSMSGDWKLEWKRECERKAKAGARARGL